jgi:UDP-N-acetylmuramoyl-tripeptide--D-alanyl-D-alanine ligase
VNPSPQGLFVAQEIVQATRGKLLGGDPGQGLMGISTDTRSLRPGELFVALRGERFDGHEFLSQALARGAAGVMGRPGSLSPPPPGWAERTALIEVPDPLYALGEIARYWRAKHPIPLLAITGSNGKTTTKEMAAEILSGDRAVLKNEGNLNNRIGLPLSLLRLRNHHRCAVLEMGLNEPGEIQRLAEIAQPQFGLITQVAPVHLEGLGSIEGVARAKGELFDALKGKDTAVVNLDDPWVVRLARRCAARRVTFGQERQATVQVVRLEPFHQDGARVTLKIADRECRVQLQCHGLPCVQNAVAAAASAWAMDVGVDQIVDGLWAFRPFSMRMNVIHLRDGIRLIDDSYNANPVSVSAALETLYHLAKGRSIAVLGDMLELGEQSADAHRDTGRKAGNLGVEVLIGAGDWAEALTQGALESASPPPEIHTVSSAAQAAEMVLDLCKPGDCILVKGSRRMAMECVVNAIRARWGPVI